MHPVIILWAHPRSMSTALERVMRERGDHQCLHEPFLRYYYLTKTGKELPHFDATDDHPNDYAGTREAILNKAGTSPVFVKDMSYYVMPEILDDVEFCKKVRHCFLIRHPVKSILSYYKLDNKVSSDEIGFEAQWKHLIGLEAMGINNSVVINAEDIQMDTERTMQLFWTQLGLDYKDQALSWSQETTPKDWQYVEGWHEQASQSGGIRKPDSDQDQKALKEFNDLAEIEPKLKQYLEHHLPFYEQLKARAILPFNFSSSPKDLD